MTKFEDRRAFKRFIIPKGQVFYKKQKKLPILYKFNGPASMKDISKSGVCFTVEKSLQQGEIVIMEIIIPGFDKIQLKGEIRWIGPQKEVGATFTGLQFLPFGVKKHFNSLDTLNKLRSITAHLEKLEGKENSH